MGPNIFMSKTRHLFYTGHIELLDNQFEGPHHLITYFPTYTVTCTDSGIFNYYTVWFMD